MIDIYLDIVLVNQAQKLAAMDTGCKYMFEQDKTDELKLMYDVFSRSKHCVDFIIVQMNDFIQMEGTKIISNAENLKDPVKFTQELLNFK